MVERSTSRRTLPPASPRVQEEEGAHSKMLVNKELTVAASLPRTAPTRLLQQLYDIHSLPRNLPVDLWSKPRLTPRRRACGAN